MPPRRRATSGRRRTTTSSHTTSGDGGGGATRLTHPPVTLGRANPGSPALRFDADPHYGLAERVAGRVGDGSQAQAQR